MNQEPNYPEATPTPEPQPTPTSAPEPMPYADETYETPTATAMPSDSANSGGKSNNKTIIIAIVVAVLLIVCCCCAAAGIYLWNNGDELINEISLHGSYWLSLI